MRFSKLFVMCAVCVSHAAIAAAQTAPGSTVQQQGSRVPTPETSATETAPDPIAVQEPNSTDTSSENADIVVTGSRTVRDGSAAPTPVTALSTDTLLQTAPSNIADALNKLPQFSGSTSQAAGGTFNAGSTPLGNYLNLRGLGSQRLLVLLDGQRVPPTTNTNAVDTNVLPQALIRRVDVVTGGVSAIYGSDAVSGVVNYVLDDRFKGLKITAQAGVSDKGDGGSYRLGGAFGFGIGDRIHIVGSYERYSNDGIGSLYDRDWAHDSGILTGAATVANPLRVTFNARRNNLNDGGVVLAGALAGRRFQTDGSLATFVPGQATNSAIYNVGGDGAVFGTAGNGATSIAGFLHTDQAFSRATVDVTDSIQFYAQGIYARSKTGFNATPSNQAFGAAGGNRTLTLFADNPYLRSDIAGQLAAAGQTSFSLGRIYNDIPLVTQRSDTEFYSGQAGVKADLGGSWKADATYVYGRSALNVDFNEFDTRRLYAAVDSVRDPATGRIVCGVTLRNPSLLPGCVPVNILGAGNIMPEAFNYIRQDSSYRVVNELQYVNANIRGNLFDLPAGPVTVAIGAEYREQKLRQTSDSDPAVFNGPNSAAFRAAYFNGIRGVPGNALRSLSVNVGSGEGKQTVKEAYGELSVPLLKDTTLFQNLDLDLAARVTDYRTSGSVTTWKIGGSWTPIDGLRLRVNRSRDIAAPSLYALFAGANIETTAITDPLTNSVATVLVSTSGNPDLRPEFGKTWTVGAVAEPAFVRGLTLSVDAYQIRINGAFQTQTANQQLTDCNVSGGTASVCSLITRPFPYNNTTAANIPSLIRVVPQNLAELETKGIDFEISYRRSLEEWLPAIGGAIGLRAFVNYLDKYEANGIEYAGRALPDASNTSFGLPHWKGLLQQTYAKDGFDLSVTERLTGHYTYGSPTQVFAAPIRGPNKTYVDLNLAYNIGEKGQFQTFLNVQNLFDVEPPVQNTALAVNLTVPTDKSTYDVIGRYFTVGVRAKF